MLQGTPCFMVCPPLQGLLVRMVQGGHGPVWHLCHWEWGCPQGLRMEQGLGQVGGGAPQATGGFTTTLPQVHDMGMRDTWEQGGQAPVWQGLSHM